MSTIIRVRRGDFSGKTIERWQKSSKEVTPIGTYYEIDNKEIMELTDIERKEIEIKKEKELDRLSAIFRINISQLERESNRKELRQECIDHDFRLNQTYLSMNLSSSFSCIHCGIWKTDFDAKIRKREKDRQRKLKELY